LWTVHPQYLDARGLVALWREALLAKKVLRGATRGYRHHPQLARFRAQPAPVAALNAYLAAVHAEATSRGYRFDARKLAGPRTARRIVETRGQLAHEWAHLLRKLALRDPARERALAGVRRPRPHPSFTLRAGGVRDWERAPA
jgi:hypothetical protein